MGVPLRPGERVESGAAIGGGGFGHVDECLKLLLPTQDERRLPVRRVAVLSVEVDAGSQTFCNRFPFAGSAEVQVLFLLRHLHAATQSIGQLVEERQDRESDVRSVDALDDHDLTAHPHGLGKDCFRVVRVMQNKVEHDGFESLSSKGSARPS